MQSLSVAESNTTNVIRLSDVHITARMRRELGDVVELASSIKKYGLIQPIVLTRERRLIAGGRRAAALKLLKTETLVHGQHFIYNDEQDAVRLQAMELEENLKRKELAWHEEVLGKLQMLEVMQSIHGPSRGFGTGKSREHDGFGIRKLSEMLGENASTTSRDIEIAYKLRQFPQLAAMPTKADAVRKLGVAVTVAAMQKLATKSVVSPAPPNAPVASGVGVGGLDTTATADAVIGDHSTAASAGLQTQKWRLYEGRFQESILDISSGSVDLVLTDLPYNIGLGTSTAAHSAGLGGFVDDSLDITVLCNDVARESYRVMRDNRFAVFFYGMNYHGVLYDALTMAGFTVDSYPFIWLRDRTAPPDGFARYSKTYDPALIASKGTPRFIRPNLANSMAIPSVRGPERLHTAQKPVAIMQKFIEDMTTPDCVVLDMFAGAGTTGEAALRTGRKAILFELEPSNCVLIRARLGAIK